jgi:hypothetical protein
VRLWIHRRGRIWHLGCLTLGHRWGWPTEVTLPGGGRAPARLCQRCPGVLWLDRTRQARRQRERQHQQQQQRASTDA